MNGTNNFSTYKDITHVLQEKRYPGSSKVKQKARFQIHITNRRW
jgi:hypothetical protein